MFPHQMCHRQGACFVTLSNYINKIAAVFKINKVFRILKLPSVIKRLLINEVCLVAVSTICNKYGNYYYMIIKSRVIKVYLFYNGLTCVLMLLLCLPGTYFLNFNNSCNCTYVI